MGANGEVVWKIVNGAYQSAYQRTYGASPQDDPLAMYAQAEWDAQVKALPAGASKGRTLSWRGLFNEIASGVAGFWTG